MTNPYFLREAKHLRTDHKDLSTVGSGDRDTNNFFVRFCIIIGFSLEIITELYGKDSRTKGSFKWKASSILRLFLKINTL